MGRDPHTMYSMSQRKSDASLQGLERACSSAIFVMLAGQQVYVQAGTLVGYDMISLHVQFCICLWVSCCV